MIALSKEQIFILHKCIYDRYGGSYGLRDEGLLDSALMAPFQTFGSQDLYPEDKDKIAHMAYALISNHPFHDGNKRIGALALLTLLQLNGYTIEATNDDFTQLIYQIAQGVGDDRDIKSWIETHEKSTNSIV